MKLVKRIGNWFSDLFTFKYEKLYGEASAQAEHWEKLAKMRKQQLDENVTYCVKLQKDHEVKVSELRNQLQTEKARVASFKLKFENSQEVVERLRGQLEKDSNSEEGKFLN